MYKLAEETNILNANVSLILQNIEVFEFEDRKTLQSIILELSNNFPDVIENTLYPERHNIVEVLVSKYSIAGMATFVGKVLRLFTKSAVRIHHIMPIIETC